MKDERINTGERSIRRNLCFASGFGLRFGRHAGNDYTVLGGTNHSCLLANLVEEVTEITVSVRLVRRQALILFAEDKSRHVNALKRKRSKS